MTRLNPCPARCGSTSGCPACNLSPAWGVISNRPVTDQILDEIRALRQEVASLRQEIIHRTVADPYGPVHVNHG